MAVVAAAVMSLGHGPSAQAGRTPYDMPLPAVRPVSPPPAEPLSSELGADGLAVGITEPNPGFLWPTRERSVPDPFAPWRAELDAMRPSLYRLIVDWATLQPAADRGPGVGAQRDGCGRSMPPCAAYDGLREQLRAIHAQQLARPDGRWHVLVVLAGTPAWAASPARGGCEPPGVQARSRAPRPGALRAYQAVVEQIGRLAMREGVAIRYWSAWNEPNHPYTVSPQRRHCASHAASVVQAPYARLVRAMHRALQRLPGEQRMVLGEAAGFTRPTARGTTIAELIRALPGDVVCASAIWAQHAYVGATDPVPTALRELDRHRCAIRHHVWVTETGAPGARRVSGRRVDPRTVRRSCRSLERRLRGWWRDPRVDVALQYSLREDPVFPYGLVATDLRRAYPTLGLLRAWSGDRPTAEPARRGACEPATHARALPSWLAPGWARQSPVPAATAPAW